MSVSRLMPLPLRYVMDDPAKINALHLDRENFREKPSPRPAYSGASIQVKQGFWADRSANTGNNKRDSRLLLHKTQHTKVDAYGTK